MRSIVDHEGHELARLLKMQEYGARKSQFFTDPGESLQVGSLNFTATDHVEPHIHRMKTERDVYPQVELIIVLAGKATAEIYDERKTLVDTLLIKTGDMLLLRRGGHGYRFQENTQLLDIRCGPYIDKEHDKEMIQ